MAHPPARRTRPATLWRSLALLSENPMCALECRRSGRGWGKALPAALLAGLLYWPAAIAIARTHIVPWPLRELVEAILLYGPYLLPDVPAAVLTAGYVSRSIRTGAWTHLLLTPLSPDDKLLGVLWPSLAPAVVGTGALVGAALAASVVSGEAQFTPALAIAGTAALLGVLAGSLVGVWAAVRFPRQGTAMPVAFFASLCLASLTVATAVALVEGASRLIDEPAPWELRLSDPYGAAAATLALTLSNALACALLWLVVPHRLCPDG